MSYYIHTDTGISCTRSHKNIVINSSPEAITYIYVNTYHCIIQVRQKTKKHRLYFQTYLFLQPIEVLWNMNNFKQKIHILSQINPLHTEQMGNN